MNQELIQDCINGDRKAQFKLYKDCFPILMAVCLRYKKTEEDSKIILNEGFLKILNNLKSYSPPAPFEAWIRRIMINTIIDDFRKYRKVKEVIEYADMTSSQENYDKIAIDYNRADQEFDAEQIQELIGLLPPVSQKVFNLFAIDGYSHKEIGEMLDISVGTSKWHLSFSRKKIQELIKEMLDTTPKRSMNI